MTKENITKIELNIYDGERSEIPSVYTDTEHKPFCYGDAFGHDGKAFWIDMTQNLEEHDDVEEEHAEYYKIILRVVRDIIR